MSRVLSFDLLLNYGVTEDFLLLQITFVILHAKMYNIMLIE